MRKSTFPLVPTIPGGYHSKGPLYYPQCLISGVVAGCRCFLLVLVGRAENQCSGRVVFAGTHCTWCKLCTHAGTDRKHWG